MPADKKIQTIRILAIVTFLLLLVMGTITIYTLGIVKGNIYWVQHTKDVLQVSDELYASALEAESSARGYALTRDGVFKESYGISRAKTYDLLDSLQMLSSDNLAQQSNIRELHKDLDTRIAQLDESILIAPADKIQAYPPSPERLRNAMRQSEIIKKKLSEINKFENLMLIRRNRGLESNLNTLPGFLLFTTLIGIGISGLSLYTVIQYNRHRLSTQRAIYTYQQQLTEQISRLNTSNKELEQFAYVASHDLQEPLRKIIAFSDLLNDQYQDKLEGDAALYLNRIVSSAGRMRTLINDLLNYSRVSRKNTPDETVELDAILAAITEDLEILISEKQGSVMVSDLPVVKGNPSELRQLFQNLIVNALKFSKPGVPSEIRVRAALAGREMVVRFPTLDTMRNYYAIWVSDNGIGFESQYAEKIFVIFQRLHGKDKYEGTGIGLAVCKKIVEKLHGAIYAESEPGKGSHFIILLPVPDLALQLG